MQEITDPVLVEAQRSYDESLQDLAEVRVEVFWNTRDKLLARLEIYPDLKHLIEQYECARDDVRDFTVFEPPHLWEEK